MIKALIDSQVRHLWCTVSSAKQKMFYMQEPARNHRNWTVLSGLFLVYMASNGITLHTLPLLYPELMEHYGWRESEVTLPATVFFIVGAITSPPAGWLLDRYSARLIISLGSLLLALALVAYSATQSLWQLVAVYAVLGVALSLCGLVSNMVLLTQWFERGRGRATGILLTASSLGGVLFPLAVGGTIEALGWRHAVLITGALVGVVMLGSAMLLLRDGRTALAPAEPRASATHDIRRLLPLIMNTRFLAIVFATGSLWFIIIALTQHQSIYLARDVGLERSFLPTVFSIFFGSSIVGKLTFGALADRYPIHRVMPAAIFTLALSLLILSHIVATDLLLLISYAVLGGLGFSGAFTCIQILLATHYSGAYYGRILALVVLIDTLCGALGTRSLGLLREWQGDYIAGFSALSALAVFSGIVVMRLSGSPAERPG